MTHQFYLFPWKMCGWSRVWIQSFYYHHIILYHRCCWYMHFFCRIHWTMPRTCFKWFLVIYVIANAPASIADVIPKVSYRVFWQTCRRNDLKTLFLRKNAIYCVENAKRIKTHVLNFLVFFVWLYFYMNLFQKSFPVSSQRKLCQIFNVFCFNFFFFFSCYFCSTRYSSC